MVAIKTVIFSVALAAVAVNAQGQIPDGQVTLPAATVEVPETATETIAADATATGAVDEAVAATTAAVDEAEPTGTPTDETEPEVSPAAEDGTETAEAPAADATAPPAEASETPEPSGDEEPEATVTAIIPVVPSVTGTETVVIATGDATPASAANGTTVNTGAPGATDVAPFDGAASTLSWSKEIAVVGAALFGFAMLF